MIRRLWHRLQVRVDKHKDVSKSPVEAEFGMLVDLNGFSLSIGYSTLVFSEGMLTFGVGLSLKR